MRECSKRTTRGIHRPDVIGDVAEEHAARDVAAPAVAIQRAAPDVAPMRGAVPLVGVRASPHDALRAARLRQASEHQRACTRLAIKAMPQPSHECH